MCPVRRIVGTVMLVLVTQISLADTYSLGGVLSGIKPISSNSLMEKSLGTTNRDTVLTRHKRVATRLTSAEIQMTLDKHNDLRRLENASNMRKMVRSNTCTDPTISARQFRCKIDLAGQIHIICVLYYQVQFITSPW